MRIDWSRFISVVLAAGLAACEQGEEDTRSERVDLEARLPSPEEGAKSPPGEKPVGATERVLSGTMTGVYKFVDDQGVVHYVDSIQKIPPKYRKRAHHPTGGAVTIIPSTPIDDLVEKHGLGKKRFGPEKEGRHDKIYLYTTSWCPVCNRARAYLRKRGIEFVEKNVESNQVNLEEMLHKSGGARGVPVIDVRGKVLRGFSRRTLERALGR